MITPMLRSWRNRKPWKLVGALTVALTSLLAFSVPVGPAAGATPPQTCVSNTGTVSGYGYVMAGAGGKVSAFGNGQGYEGDLSGRTASSATTTTWPMPLQTWPASAERPPAGEPAVDTWPPRLWAWPWDPPTVPTG